MAETVLVLNGLSFCFQGATLGAPSRGVHLLFVRVLHLRFLLLLLGDLLHLVQGGNTLHLPQQLLVEELLLLQLPQLHCYLLLDFRRILRRPDVLLDKYAGGGIPELPIFNVAI